MDSYPAGPAWQPPPLRPIEQVVGWIIVVLWLGFFFHVSVRYLLGDLVDRRHMLRR